jgi:SAM-dependent methyltransferase
VRRYVAEHEIDNVEFRVGSVYDLDFPADAFDACLCHSMLETLDRPLDGLVELRRVLKPGGVLGVACVEYGGLVLAGPAAELLGRFYDIREQVWQLENAADPYRGRQLRGLLERAGFRSVIATSKYFSYGTAEAVESFGVARAEDCNDGWFRHSATAHRLASAPDFDAMQRAWLEWSKSPDAYLAFAWCRALGWKPSEAR